MTKLSNSIIAVFAVIFSTSLNAQVQPSTMAQCLSTDIVSFDGNIVEAAVATPSLSTLVTAVEVAGQSRRCACHNGGNYGLRTHQ